MLAGGCLVFRVGRRRTLPAAWCLTGVTAALLAAVALTLVPAIDRRKSARPFCEGLTRRFGRSPCIAVYGQRNFAHILFGLPRVRRVRVIQKAMIFYLDGRTVALDRAAAAALPPGQRGRLRRTGRISPVTWQRFDRFFASGGQAIVFKNRDYTDLPPAIKRRLDVEITAQVSNDVFYAAVPARR
jgi:hypothetical protein